MPDEDREENPIEINPAEVRVAAMNLLARREHSRSELLQKLLRRFPDRELLSAELQRLADENLQSDRRYVESFVRQRAGRGYGPRRLRQELRQRDVDDADIADALASDELDWTTLAEEVFRKKFGAPGKVELQERTRRVRFMEYRGFCAGQYRHLIDD
jgi:regulatory protein